MAFPAGGTVNIVRTDTNAVVATPSVNPATGAYSASLGSFPNGNIPFQSQYQGFSGPTEIDNGSSSSVVDEQVGPGSPHNTATTLAISPNPAPSGAGLTAAGVVTQTS